MERDSVPQSGTDNEIATESGPTSGSTQSTEPLKSVMNAIAVLSAFRGVEEWGVAELARELELPKSVVHRLLHTLAAGGFLVRSDQRGTYLLGPGIAALASAAERSAGLVAVAHPHLERLTAETRETTMLAVLRGDHLLHVDGVDALQQTIRFAVRVGDTQPIHAGSGAKVLLALQPEAEIERVLGQPLERYTENTITDPDAMRAELAEARRLGWSYSDSEITPQSRSVSAPVFGAGGAVVASVTVSAPAYRIEADDVPRLAELVVATAADISAAMGASSTTTQRGSR